MKKDERQRVTGQKRLRSFPSSFHSSQSTTQIALPTMIKAASSLKRGSRKKNQPPPQQQAPPVAAPPERPREDHRHHAQQTNQHHPPRSQMRPEQYQQAPSQHAPSADKMMHRANSNQRSGPTPEQIELTKKNYRLAKELVSAPMIYIVWIKFGPGCNSIQLRPKLCRIFSSESTFARPYLLLSIIYRASFVCEIVKSVRM